MCVTLDNLNTRDNGRWTTRRYCQEHQSLSLYDILSTGRHLSDISFVTNLKSTLFTAVTT